MLILFEENAVVPLIKLSSISANGVDSSVLILESKLPSATVRPSTILFTLVLEYTVELEAKTSSISKCVFPSNVVMRPSNAVSALVKAVLIASTLLPE